MNSWMDFRGTFVIDHPPFYLPYSTIHEHDPFKSEIMWTVAGLIQASQTHSDEK